LKNRNCQLEGDINVSRAFGLVKHSPIVIADPFIKEEKVSFSFIFIYLLFFKNK